MTTRIMFNGQEYASAEAMPEDVRKVYQHRAHPAYWAHWAPSVRRTRLTHRRDRYRR